MEERRYADAEQLAEKLVRDEGFKPPIDVLRIAKDMGILVHAKKDTAAGVSGMLVRHGNDFAIVYATHIESPGFQRFSIAHELGHLQIPGHPEAVLAQGQHISRGGFGSRDPIELEADHFASGLLMPTHLFRRELGKFSDGFAAIDGLADLFQTSLTASAIRYARLTDAHLAVVMSTDGSVDYCFSSEALRRMPGYRHLKKGMPLPPDSLTKQFNRNRRNVLDGQRDDDETDAMSWFHTDGELPAVEEVVGLGPYGKTLTVVTVDSLSLEDD